MGQVLLRCFRLSCIIVSVFALLGLSLAAPTRLTDPDFEDKLTNLNIFVAQINNEVHAGRLDLTKVILDSTPGDVRALHDIKSGGDQFRGYSSRTTIFNKLFCTYNDIRWDDDDRAAAAVAMALATGGEPIIYFRQHEPWLSAAISILEYRSRSDAVTGLDFRAPPLDRPRPSPGTKPVVKGSQIHRTSDGRYWYRGLYLDVVVSHQEVVESPNQRPSIQQDSKVGPSATALESTGMHWVQTPSFGKDIYLNLDDLYYYQKYKDFLVPAWKATGTPRDYPQNARFVDPGPSNPKDKTPVEKAINDLERWRSNESLVSRIQKVLRPGGWDAGKAETKAGEKPSDESQGPLEDKKSLTGAAVPARQGESHDGSRKTLPLRSVVPPVIPNPLYARDCRS